MGVKVTLFFSVGCTLLYVMQHKCQETYLCQLAVQIDVFGINFSDDFVFRVENGGIGEKKKKVSEKDAFFFCYAARLLSIFIFKTSLVFSIVSLREVILQK